MLESRGKRAVQVRPGKGQYLSVLEGESLCRPLWTRPKRPWSLPCDTDFFAIALLLCSLGDRVSRPLEIMPSQRGGIFSWL